MEIETLETNTHVYCGSCMKKLGVRKKGEPWFVRCEECEAKYG